MHRRIQIVWCTLLLGCATGNVREREVGALGRYRDLEVRVAPPRGTAPSPAVSEQIQRSVAEGLQTWNARPRKDAPNAFTTRLPADERLLFTPTALLLEPGEWVISDDQVLLFHLGVGVTRWLELNLTLGGLPIPAAGGIPFVGHGIGGAGGAAGANVQLNVFTSAASKHFGFFQVGGGLAIFDMRINAARRFRGRIEPA